MTTREAREIAHQLGMSIWKRPLRDEEGIAIGVEKCVGFASAGFAVACGDCWEQALDRAVGLVFSA